MRLLHTSDWHLGRSLHGLRLLDEQAEALDAIVALTDDADVDVVVIAGDVYDRSVPPSEAVALFDDVIVRLRDTGARVVVIPGNHDSATRLGAGGRLTERAGVAIRGALADLGRPVLLEADGQTTAVYAVPYLEPLIASSALAAATDDGTDVLRALRLSQHQLMLRALAVIRADRSERHVHRAVVVAHTFVAGAMASDSERDIAVGGVELTTTDAFDSFDYVALGHLHRPQLVSGSDRIAYSGSPLPYSFSEEHDAKSVRLVDLHGDRLDTEVVPLDVGTPLRSIRGTIDDLLVDPAHAAIEHCNLRVELTDPALPLHAKARLETRFARVLQLRHRPPVVELEAAQVDTERRASPLDLTEQFLTEHLGPLTPCQEDLLHRAVEAALHDEVPA